MGIRSALFAALLALPSLALAVTGEDMQAPALITRVDGRVVIDRDGHVADYTLKTGLPAPLADRIVELVRNVRFEPVEVDGRVVAAQADMRLSIAATTLPDGGLRLALDNLVFPEASDAASGPRAALVKDKRIVRVGPVYPRDALQAGANANVLAVLRIAPDGSVRDVAVQQSALLHARMQPRVAARVLAMFERASMVALRQWRVDPSLMAADAPKVDGDWVALVPVAFRLDGVPDVLPPGQWRLEMRTAKRPPAWLATDAKTPQPGASDLAGDEVGVPNTRYRLAAPLAALAP